MAKTLVVGATGHLGTEIVNACRNAGHDVHALIRPATRGDAAKMQPLQAARATIHEGDLADYDSLLKACLAVDNVVSVIGSLQIGDEGPLIKAVKDAGVARFIPSDFGLDPAAAGPGASALFDAKIAVQTSIKASGIPYTFVHANAFFSYWVFSLGDLSKLGGALPPAEVNVYGTGHVKGAFASVADIATVTVRALNDPGMVNKEVRITANTMTQTELIDTWQKISGKRVQHVAVTAAEVEGLIASATAPDQQMMRIGTELHRSMWIRGDAVTRAGVALEATEVYPDIAIQTVEAGLARLL